jgi:hypothetical protein
MNAFSSLIILIIIATLSLSLVAYSNYLVIKRKRNNLLLEKMKVRIEDLERIVIMLDHICEKRVIAKLINEEIIEHYQLMQHINPDAGDIKAGLSNAQRRANKLSKESTHRQPNRVSKSDAQIARYTTYLDETLHILHKQHTEGKIADEDMDSFSFEIKWLQLTIKAISNIIQGHHCANEHNTLAANAFYKKAQDGLINSSHPDERRLKMIEQLTEIIHGRRQSLDGDLMPETEHNPNHSTASSHEDNALDTVSDSTSTEDENTVEKSMIANKAIKDTTPPETRING